MSEDQRNPEPEAPETLEPPETRATAQNDAPTESATSANNAASASDDPATRIAELERLLAAEREAATDYMQRWQRAMADFSNFKRRAGQEQEQREQLLGAQALMPVLHALDSFERAFAALPETLRGYSWIEGVALVEAQLRRALEMAGITETPAEPGQPFDPARHQAIGEIATDQYPPGSIAALIQRGYQVASLLMRPALVQVAHAPEAKEATATQEATQPADAEGATPEPPAETQPSGPAP
jgi:molecular chaperone GrpE